MAEGSILARPIEGRRTGGEVFLRAFAGGPLWAAYHALWGLYALAAAVDILGLILLLKAWPAGNGGWGLTGLALIATMRGIVGARAVALATQTEQRPREDGIAGGADGLIVGAAMLAISYPLTIYRFVAEEPVEALMRFPAPAGLDLATSRFLDGIVTWMKRNWVEFFDAITIVLRFCLNFVEMVFVQTPWPVVALAAVLAALRLSGVRAMVFTAACLAYLGLFGFWEKSMATLALVATSVIICTLIGLPLGILAGKSRRSAKLLEPILDVMQTLPTFVYLIPAVAFFSIGKPPGVIATVIFALPPIVRLTALGIRQVPAGVKEAADAFGATPLQLLTKVELPLAGPSIRLGINQTIMMCLSMVVVAAMIGAGGLGLDVIRSLQMLKTGQGFLAGMAIVLCAMMLERIVRGRERRTARETHD